MNYSYVNEKSGGILLIHPGKVPDEINQNYE